MFPNHDQIQENVQWMKDAFDEIYEMATKKDFSANCNFLTSSMSISGTFCTVTIHFDTLDKTIVIANVQIIDIPHFKLFDASGEMRNMDKLIKQIEAHYTQIIQAPIPVL